MRAVNVDIREVLLAEIRSRLLEQDAQALPSALNGRYVNRPMVASSSKTRPTTVRSTRHTPVRRRP
jgi:hypothetical protein